MIKTIREEHPYGYSLISKSETLCVIVDKIDEIVTQINYLISCFPGETFVQNAEDYRQMANIPTKGFCLENIDTEFADKNWEKMREISKQIAEWIMNAEEYEIIKNLARCHPKSLVRMRDKINVFLNSDPRDDSIK